eukprot:scaffold1576_cov102-Isochrysis_galbana.AAC.3
MRGPRYGHSRTAGRWKTGALAGNRAGPPPARHAGQRRWRSRPQTRWRQMWGRAFVLLQRVSSRLIASGSRGARQDRQQQQKQAWHALATTHRSAAPLPGSHK